MRPLSEILRANRRLRAIGFDDAPFAKVPGAPVPLVGIVTSATRFEGMLWGSATRDGRDATGAITSMLERSKFAAQVHVVLTDGLTVGGLNVLDLAAIASSAGVPCIAVMRRPPDLARFRGSLATQPDGDARWEVIQRAGPVHERDGFVFQVVGADPASAAGALARLTDRGKVPEPLRLAHLIGAAVVTGQSGKRA
ncbi:MAG: DUF99 family protein [Alphaproteobacteria bacterium]|nr:DUF99 family protein [Alphaproteobacteria bacterium]